MSNNINLIQSEQCINFQQNTNQAEQNLQEKDVSDKIQLPEFSSKFRDYLEQSSQTQDNPLKQNNQTDEVLESQKDSTSRGFYLSSIEQSNEKINNNSKKPALKLFNKNKIIYSDLKQQQKSNSSKIRLFQNQNLNQNNILESKGINLQRSQSTQNIKVRSFQYFKQKFKAIQDTNLFNKVKKDIFQNRLAYYCQKIKHLTAKILCFKKKNIDDQDQMIQLNSQISLMKQQINKQLNILDFYKDLIFIKKSIMILLSKEQLAAIQLVGYSSLFMTDGYSKQKDKNLSDQKYKNYLEKQQNILNSYDLKCKYIEKFMKNSLNAEYDKNDINSRILSSIICENN
ncbi:hypothetical protein ABPG73_011036 [Tetrahymena malaccensis]